MQEEKQVFFSKQNFLFKEPNWSIEEFYKVPVKVLYFSARWCPSSLSLTPILIQYYKEWNQIEKNCLEVLFISLDKTTEEFAEYYATMPWLTLAFEDPFRTKLIEEFDGVPSLLIILNENGFVKFNSGFEDILNLKEKALQKWSEIKKSIYTIYLYSDFIKLRYPLSKMVNTFFGIPFETWYIIQPGTLPPKSE